MKPFTSPLLLCVLWASFELHPVFTTSYDLECKAPVLRKNALTGKVFVASPATYCGEKSSKFGPPFCVCNGEGLVECDVPPHRAFGQAEVHMLEICQYSCYCRLHGTILGKLVAILGIGEDEWRNARASFAGASICVDECDSHKGCASVRQSRKHCEKAVCMSEIEYTPETATGLLGHCMVPSWTAGEMKKGRLGKRESDQVACLCNSTYVSPQCCWEETGIVHEAGPVELI